MVVTGQRNRGALPGLRQRGQAAPGLWRRGMVRGCALYRRRGIRAHRVLCRTAQI